MGNWGVNTVFFFPRERADCCGASWDLKLDGRLTLLLSRHSLLSCGRNRFTHQALILHLYFDSFPCSSTRRSGHYFVLVSCQVKLRVRLWALLVFIQQPPHSSSGCLCQTLSCVLCVLSVCVSVFMCICVCMRENEADKELILIHGLNEKLFCCSEGLREMFVFLLWVCVSLYLCALQLCVCVCLGLEQIPAVIER